MHLIFDYSPGLIYKIMNPRNFLYIIDGNEILKAVYSEIVKCCIQIGIGDIHFDGPSA